MADHSKKASGWAWLGPVALAFLAMKVCSGSSSYRPPPDFHPPDFTRFDFQKQLDLAKALEHLPPVPVDATAPQGLASGMIFLEPAHESEAGVHATLDTTGEIPRLHVSNDSQPRAFLAGVTVKLSCLGVPEQTLAVGSLAFDKTVVVDTSSDIKSCPRAPLFEAQAKNRWEATARAADEVARKILQSSDRPPEGALDYLSSQFTSAGGRVLLLLAARGSAEARHAQVVAFPSSRRFLHEALPAISDPATPLYAMLALPDHGAPVLRLSPDLRLRGLDDALLLAVERDHKLPRDAYLPAAKRPGLLELVEARERFRKVDESEAANRQQAARAAVAEALGTFADDAAAAVLVHDLVQRESD